MAHSAWSGSARTKRGSESRSGSRKACARRVAAGSMKTALRCSIESDKEARTGGEVSRKTPPAESVSKSAAVPIKEPAGPLAAMLALENCNAAPGTAELRPAGSIAALCSVSEKAANSKSSSAPWGFLRCRRRVVASSSARVTFAPKSWRERRCGQSVG